MMTTTMTKEELRDALLQIAKQAYQEGQRDQLDNDIWRPDDGTNFPSTFEDTKTYKEIMENGS